MIYAAPNGQATLPGFEHLQEYYIIKRDSEAVGVPVDELSDNEIDEKVAQLQAMSVACEEHAKELIRFKKLRRSKALAAK